MRTYIGPIGFNPTSVTRAILSNGLDDGDVVALVRPEDETDDRRAEETMTDVRRTLGAMEPEIATRIERVPHDDFEAAVLACHDLVRSADGDRILVLGGGARDVLLPLTVAGLAATDCISLTLGFSDVDHAVRELHLPNLTASLTDSVGTTLATVEREGASSLPEIAELVDHSKSTVTRHVSNLEERRLVETWMEGKSKHVRITTAGRLLTAQPGDP